MIQRSESSEVNKLEIYLFVCFWIVKVFAITSILQLLLLHQGGLLQYYCIYLNFLQMLVHMPLLNVNIPGSLLQLLRGLWPQATFKDAFRYDLIKDFFFTDTPPYSVKFD